MKLLSEKQAAEAYLKFLQNKGAATGVLYRRSMFLDKLIAGLAGKPHERAVYGLALNEALKGMPQQDVLECQNTAREFYPFWMNDIKAIAAFEQHHGFDVRPVKWKPLPASLDKLTESLEHEFFDENDRLALLKYSHHLGKLGADDLVVDTRLKLAKVVLVRLRDAPVKNNKTYRMAVDITLPLFKTQEIKNLFLAVVREFFYFWTEASSNVKRVA